MSYVEEHVSEHKFDPARFAVFLRQLLSSDHGFSKGALSVDTVIVTAG